MSTGSTKCSKIRHIVKLRQLLRQWRRKARMSSSNRTPSDVPAGHVAVRVGIYRTRYVMPASYLNHAVFKKLLTQAEEEYGFANNQGPLAIPCDESLFEEVVRYVESTARVDRNCHVDVSGSSSSSSSFDFLADSRPLLRGFSEKTLW